MVGSRSDDIAIVGMAGMFPGAPDVRTFWENILAKRCSISDHPDPEAVHLLDPESDAFERVYSLRGGFLKDIARFDPVKYGVPPLTVASGDTDQFLAVKVASEALEDAGLGDGNFPRERTEVILGHGSYFNPGNIVWFQRGVALDQTIKILRQLNPDLSDTDADRIRQYLDKSLPQITAQTPPTLIPNIISGRVANRLDLMGANYIVDGACASSLIALDNAAKDLLLDRCDLVLAGGVQACMPALELMLFCAVGAMSRHPALRPFDKDADGTMLGEGVGILVLKRLPDAERDGDRVYAVIKGCGVASDGRARALLAPRVEGGALAIRRAYENAGIDPQTVELIEAHGTGIPLGDRTEIGALRVIFGSREGRYPRIAVGGVKSNIGHCRPAAGIAGAIKATFALYHKILPPTANCDAPNPDLNLEETPFYINMEARPWIRGKIGSPRRAGINALGFGGIDSHCILEEYTGD
jgi:acyl transferase domain-containing protein